MRNIDVYLGGFLATILLTASVCMFLFGIAGNNMPLTILCGFLVGFNGMEVYHYKKLIKEIEK